MSGEFYGAVYLLRLYAQEREAIAGTCLDLPSRPHFVPLRRGGGVDGVALW